MWIVQMAMLHYEDYSSAANLCMQQGGADGRLTYRSVATQ
jgi:hypothetical protein